MNFEELKKYYSIAGAILFLTAAVINLGKELSDRKYTRAQVMEMMQREAALSGHAQWIVGPDGSATFSWKTCKHIEATKPQ